ncbi:hypothetical protein F4818DRAFT_238325 [Hypoxylon cercidicola]|nr:hypothetical protein F4818DRAFT_238325 [Hypoxylon cercidicola]
MADPIGITGTAVGIVSLCLQLYGGLKNYLDNFRDRDEYISKALLRLDLLRSLTNDVESTIPTLQSGHYAPSQAVLLSLKACETEMKSLDAELQKFKGTTSVNLREKLKEAKRKVQFPFARSELDKLVCGLDRMNSLLKLALQGLQLYVVPRCIPLYIAILYPSGTNTAQRHVQSANQGKLIDIDDTARTALASIAKVDTKIDEIQSRGAALEAGIRSNEITITDISRNIHGLSHATTEIRSSVSQINQIQANTSSSIGLLRDLSVGHQAQRVNTVILEERMSELTYAITHANDNSPQERFFKMLMSKPDVLRRWQDDVATLGHVPSDDPPEDAQELSRLKRKHQMHSKAGNCGCRYRRHVSRQSSRWLIFTRFDESIVDYHHDPGCPRYSNPGETREYTAGIIYTGLHRLLNIAVVASLTSRYGAGGASISPTFRYYAMVDSRQSPAFGIVRRMALVILNMCVYTYDSVGMHDSKATDMACQQIIRVGISKLRRIFTSRSSLPTDINERGWTLIESCVDYYTLFDRDMWDHPNAKGMTRSLLQSLLELGVPRMTDSSNSY